MKPLLLPVLALLAVAGATQPRTPPGHAPATGSELVVVVTGLRNDKGLVNLAVFSGEAGFPEGVDRAAYKVSLELQGRALPASGLEIRLPDVAPGAYAAIVLHDENGNLKMDRNRIGIPKEGYGVSNDARSRFGPPKYAAARFEMGSTPRRLEIPIHY